MTGPYADDHDPVVGRQVYRHDDFNTRPSIGRILARADDEHVRVAWAATPGRNAPSLRLERLDELVPYRGGDTTPVELLARQMAGLALAVDIDPHGELDADEDAYVENYRESASLAAWARQHLPAELAPTLQPVPRTPPGPDDVTVAARFGEASITARRTLDPSGRAVYQFTASGPGRPNAAADKHEMGVLAAGDRTEHHARESIYDELGDKVAEHLRAVTDAVAEYRATLPAAAAPAPVATPVAGPASAPERSL